MVVETAISSEHGAFPGAAVGCGDQLQGPAALYMQTFCMFAGQLRQEASDAAAAAAKAAESGSGRWDPSNSSIWAEVVRGCGLWSEQLVYIAALTVEARLVYGDRPKDITYRRLYSSANAVALDRAFGDQIIQNYREYLEHAGVKAAAAPGAGVSLAPGSVVGSDDAPSAALAATASPAGSVDHVMMDEREAVMCAVVDEVCSSRRPAAAGGSRGGAAAPSAASSAAAGEVVMVVGSAHLPGIARLWASNIWKQLVGAQTVAASPLMEAEPSLAPPTPAAVPGQPPPLPGAARAASAAAAVAAAALPLPPSALHGVLAGAGIRRALLTSWMRLSVPQHVIDDMDAVLGPVPDGQDTEVFDICAEMYASWRMQLACLPRAMLDQVVVGYNCDMWDVLAPLRAVRPSEGGSGYDPEVLEQLRWLHFQIGGGGSEDEDEQEAEGQPAAVPAAEAAKQQTQQPGTAAAA